MTRDDWARVKGLVAGALALSDAERQPFLDAHCGPDAAVRNEVDSLLAAAVRAADLYEDPTLLVAGTPISPEALDPFVPRNRFEGTGRYTVRRQIGIGGMGIVYEVHDRTRDQVVALKTLLRWDAADIYRLKREFRSLADIAHPNLVSLYDLVVEDRRCFFTMELVDGVSFVEYVRATGAADVERVRRTLPQLVAGLQELHASGKLHRDIKPSNVLVTPEGRVVILDFGLTSSFARDDTAGERGLAGTPAYLAPEQCLGGEIAEASDWYSVGATVYHALTGRVPFEGPIDDLIRRKTSEDPLPVSAHVAGVPDDLDDLCMALLSRDPAKRLHGHRTAAVEVAGEPAFVGREQELDVLRAAFAAVAQSRSAAVYVHGPSGIGKTALVQRFFDRVVRGRALVLRSRCHEHESVPYKGLDGIVDSLTRHLGVLPRAEMAALMPRDADALCRLFPVLQSVVASPFPAPDGGDPVALRHRAFAALRELLTRLGARQPLVLHVDDFQWADADSAASLTELLRPPNPPPLLLLIAFRSEEIDAKPFLRALLERVDLGTKIALPLAPMTGDEVARLIATLLPPSARLEEAEIAREASGNPFLVQELTRYAALGPAAQRGATLEEMLRRRLDALPPEARAFLETLAVCGRPIRPARIFEACGLSGDERPLVARLRSAHFLRSSRSGDQVEMYHDRIREALAADVDPAATRHIHELMARLLVAHGDDDPEALFEHYRAAGLDTQAAGQAAAAAARASAVLAFDRAAAFYRSAIDLQPWSDRRADWTAGLARALENAGRPAEAADACLAAARDASDVQRVEWQRKAAEQLLIGGHIDRGLEIIRAVLPGLEMRLARRPETALASILLRRAQLRWRGLDFVERDASQIARGDLLRIDACWSITTGLAMVDNVRAAAFHARQLLIALDTGEPYRVARALALEAGFSALGGGAGIERSAAFTDHAQAMAERVRHPHAVALVSMASGIAAFLVGHWRKATELCERAMVGFRDECSGVIWELNLTQNFFLGSLLFRGELRDVSHWLPGLLETTRERGNLYFETELRTRMNLVWLAADAADEGERQANEAIARWSGGGFHRQHYNHLLAHVQTALYRGHAREAWSLVSERLAPLRRSMWLRVQFMRIETAFLRARCALAMAAGGHDAKRMRRVAEKDAARLEREHLPWPNALAALVRATLAQQAGDESSAVTRLTAAADAFGRADMQLYEAVVRRRLAAVVGGDKGRALKREADEWMAAQEIRNPPSITRFLAPGFRD